MNKKLGIRFMIVGRIMNGRSTVGYDLASMNSGITSASKDQVYMMAQAGYIVNATLQRRGNESSLVGKDGANLKELKSRQVKKTETLI